MIAQHDLNFSTRLGKVTIPKGTELKPATPEQIARAREAHELYNYYTGTYEMVLIDLGVNGEAAWVFPHDYDPKCKIKRKLTREQVETAKEELAVKIRALYQVMYSRSDAEITVSREYGVGDPKSPYLALVDAYEQPIHKNTGTTELRALRALLKEMKEEMLEVTK